MIFGSMTGTWTITSASDPRWNMSGNGFVGGFECPMDAEAAIEKKKKELGEEPPDDLRFTYMKD